MSNIRIGSSIDTHETFSINKGFIWLGGLKFDTNFKVKAISDGDVVLHAISESILGALGLGDLGDWFPEEKTKKNISSTKILENSLEQLKKHKGKIINIDVTIISQDFIIKDKKEKIKNNLISLVNSERINIKATRGVEHKEEKYISCLATTLISIG